MFPLVLSHQGVLVRVRDVAECPWSFTAWKMVANKKRKGTKKNLNKTNEKWCGGVPHRTPAPVRARYLASRVVAPVRARYRAVGGRRTRSCPSCWISRLRVLAMPVMHSHFSLGRSSSVDMMSSPNITLKLVVLKLQIGWWENYDKIPIKATNYGDHFVPMKLRDWSSISKVENNGYLPCPHIGCAIATDWLIKQFW